MTKIGIREFCKMQGLDINVVFRSHLFDSPNDPALFYAKIDKVDVREGGMLRGSFGNGNNPQEAIDNLCREYSGRSLVFDAFNEKLMQREEVDIDIHA